MEGNYTSNETNVQLVHSSDSHYYKRDNFYQRCHAVRVREREAKRRLIVANITVTMVSDKNHRSSLLDPRYR